MPAPSKPKARISRAALAASDRPDARHVVEPAAAWAASKLDELAQRDRIRRRLGRSGPARGAKGDAAPDRRPRAATGSRSIANGASPTRARAGSGISALFAGESGTGKTMAAEVLARELQLDLYRIDLSAVVSKYIGETEKNLRRVFDAAEDSGAILLFDEADALFGKRSEVKDSHDRYANIEVSYLLQRMEAYRGLAILTTNLKGALDPAFQRRLRFVVHFPFPDQPCAKRSGAAPSRRARRSTRSTTASSRASTSPAAASATSPSTPRSAPPSSRSPSPWRTCSRRAPRSQQTRTPAERRRDTGVGMRRVVVHIDRLVLRGVSLKDRDALAAEFQEELGLVFAAPRVGSILKEKGNVPSLRVVGVPIDAAGRTGGGGRSVARGIAKELVK